MSLLADFQEYFVTGIEVYSLTTYTSTIGTTEKDYPTSATRTITGYIQPIGGGATQTNLQQGNDATHRLYIYATESLNDTDRIVYSGVTYQITFNPPDGISGISDHKEVDLAVYAG